MLTKIHFSLFQVSQVTIRVTLKLNAPNFIANLNIFRIVKKIGNRPETKSFEASSNLSRRWPSLTTTFMDSELMETQNEGIE
jgi:hypothetical protein